MKQFMWVVVFVYVMLLMFALAILALLGIIGGIVTLNLWPSLAGLALVPVVVLLAGLSMYCLDRSIRA